MSKKDKVFYIVIFTLIFSSITSCNSRNKQEDRDHLIYNKAEQTIGKTGYKHLQNLISDSITDWRKNELGSWMVEDSVCSYKLDTLLCINSSKTKLIGAVLSQYKIPDNLCGGVLFLYGARIKGNWYFWAGESLFIPQEMNENIKDKKPITFSQLHKQALSQVFGGYLTKSGEINDAWFESKFKSGYTPFEDRYDYEHILDGQKINNEKDYFNYLWKGNGLGNWVTKFSTDSIRKVNQTLKPLHITREQENEITMYFSRKLINGN